MANGWADWLGTVLTSFKIGGPASTSGVTLKNSSGNLLVRNSADSADSQITVSQPNISGNNIVLNSAATNSGASWVMTLARPASGMTAAQTITLPAGNGTSGQVVQTDGAGNWSYVSAGSTASSDKIDTTTLAFGTTSPLAMFSTGAADIIEKVQIVIDTAFNGTPTVSIGITGTTSKYMPSTAIDLTAAAGTTFEWHPGLNAQGVEALIATYSAGGASAGSARILVYFASPQ